MFLEIKHSGSQAETFKKSIGYSKPEVFFFRPCWYADERSRRGWYCVMVRAAARTPTALIVKLFVW